MSSFCYSGQCITACGQWLCPLPQSNNSEILHPTPLSSINSSRVHIQFKIPLLVRNPPWTPAVYPTSFCSLQSLQNHLPLLLFHKNLLLFCPVFWSVSQSVSILVFLHWITIFQSPTPKGLFSTKASQWSFLTMLDEIAAHGSSFVICIRLWKNPSKKWIALCFLFLFVSFFFFPSDMWKCNFVTVLLGVRILPSFPFLQWSPVSSLPMKRVKALKLQQPNHRFLIRKGLDEISLKC